MVIKRGMFKQSPHHNLMLFPQNDPNKDFAMCMYQATILLTCVTLGFRQVFNFHPIVGVEAHI